MLAPKIDNVESLGALITVGSSTPAAVAADFAGLLAGITAKPGAEATVPTVAPQTFDLTMNLKRTDLAFDDREESMVVNHTSTQTELAEPAIENGLIALEEKDAVIATRMLPVVDGLPFITNTVVLVATTQDVEVEGKALRPTKPHIVDRAAEKAAIPPVDPRIVIAAPAFVDTEKISSRASVDTPDPSIAAVVDLRPGTLPQTSDKPTPPMPDRVATFAPLIADAMRDLVTLGQNKDVRFNLRPEVLGPVAVMIEHGPGGPTLRLGVETPAAAMAVRQAEPMMNDARGNASFVQVTVDLNAPDQRARSGRAPIVAKRRSDDDSRAIEPRATLAATGRYA
jgi:hypothetical protein